MKKVALINDLSGFGKCSLTAAIPVISVMGIQACPLPTAILSAQTGFGKYFYDDYTSQMGQIAKEWADMNVSFDGIYSGFLGSANQMKNVIEFLDVFKKKDTIYVCDPVLGDNGHRYPISTDELLNCMKELTSRADYITPNLTELCLLADVNYDELLSHSDKDDFLNRVTDIARHLIQKANCPQTVIVTGIHSVKENHRYIGNMAVTSTNTFYECSPFTGVSFSGTGDLFASAVCGGIMNGLPVNTAISKATSFLIPAIEEATLSGIQPNHGVNFENYLSKLIP